MDNIAFTAHAFETFLGEEKLMGARCADCGALHLPPRPYCPACHHENMAWEAVSGAGTLAAFTAVYIGSSAMIAAGHDRANPYLTGVVALAEGPMISAQILGLDAAHPDVRHIGTPLRAAFIHREEGDDTRHFLAFEVTE